MGYVYTPREYEEGRIGTPVSYKTAMKEAKEGLAKLCGEGLIFGANINGSTLHGDGGAGSDIDIVAVTNYLDAENRLRELHNDIMDSNHVYVEFVPVSRDKAEKGYHQLDYFYALYMKTFCKDGIIGNDIFTLIAPKKSWSDSKEEFKDRVSGNLDKLSKMKAALSHEYNEDRCDFLEKILRQPIYTAIDMLRLRHGNYPSENGRPLSKADSCEMYKDEFPKMGTRDLFLVLGMRTIYRDFLKKQAGKPSEYVELLNEIEDIYPDARKFMESNLDYMISHEKP